MAEADPKTPECDKQLPDITWSEREYQLDEFNKDDNLPQVVRFKEEGTKGNLPPGLKIFSDQPVLFYTRTKKKQVRARTIFRDPNGAYFEVGQTLLIPDDFEGWFEFVPPDFTKGRYCSTIAEIAKAMPNKFFTRSNIRGIRVEEQEDEAEDPEQKFLERKIPAGSILRVTSTFAAKWRTSAESGVMKKKKQEWTTVEVQYLKCLDRDNKEIMIPFKTKGKFNIIYEKGINDDRCILSIKDLISNFTLPVKVRLLYGKAPVVPCIFTGMLILKDSELEESAVGSTVLNKRNVLFELPFSTACSVNVAENEDILSSRKTYNDGRALCHKYALSYASMIKLSPNMDTDQQMYQHVPSARMKKQADGSLRTLDLITNISLTDDEPMDRFMESSSDSDRDSIQSSEMSIIPKGNILGLELKELSRNRKSSTVC